MTDVNDQPDTNDVHTQTGGETLLAIEGISKQFGGLVAVDNVSFGVREGEVLGLIGPNGAGKTTLFNVINGFLAPDTGVIHLRDRDVTDTKPNTRSQYGLARTFQLVRSFDDMTVKENVMIGAFQNTRSHDDAAERASAELERLNMEEMAEADVTSLPVQARKRMELGRALATDPDVVLIDEIMAGLNEDEQQEMLRLLSQINDEGVTLILIEHIMSAIMSLSERIIVLNEGTIIANGDPEQVVSDEGVINAYLGKRWREADDE